MDNNKIDIDRELQHMSDRLQCLIQEKEILRERKRRARREAWNILKEFLHLLWHQTKKICHDIYTYYRENTMWTLLKILIAVYVIVMCCILCTSCTTTKYVDRPYPVMHEVVKHDTLCTSDTLLMRDSIFTEVKGDTIYINKWKTRYETQWRDRVRTEVRHDSIPYEVKVREPYFSMDEMSWFNRLKMRLGGLTLILLTAGAAYLIIKLIRRWQR